MEGRTHTDTLPSRLYTLHIIGYILFCLSFIASPSIGFAKGQIIDYVIAVVNDQPITRRELETELIIREVKNPSNPSVKRSVLEELIDQKLLLQQADDIGMMLLSWRKQVNAEIQAIQSESGYFDEASFLEDLKRIGLEYQELEERLRNTLIVKALTNRQFRNNIDTEHINQEAAQYFEQHQSEFIEPAQIQFQYIVVRSEPEDAADLRTQAKTLAQTISSQLKAGATFQEIQGAYPDNPLLRFVEEQQTSPADTKDWSVIADLEVNQASQPIPIREGYLIAKLLKKEVHPRQKTYPEVSQEIRDKLIGEALQKQTQAWLTKQKETADIRILDAKLAKVPLALSVTEGQD